MCVGKIVRLATSRPFQQDSRTSFFAPYTCLEGVRVSRPSTAPGLGARAHQFPGTPFEPGGDAKRGSECGLLLADLV